MGLFDRFTSKKGKDQTSGPKRGVVKASKADKAKVAEKKAFASVGASSEEKVLAASKTVKGKASPEPKTQVKLSPSAKRVLLRPIVTEKSTRGGAQSQYTFEVATDASKADVLQSVYHVYGVTPVAVNVLTVRGKVVRFGRSYGRTANRKKAIVTLPAGKTIDVVNA